MMQLLMAEKQVSVLRDYRKTEEVEKNLIDARTVLGLYYAQMGQFC